jgi:putative NADH-flavin reductase
MNILVIGATGRTGKHVLEQGLRRGHAMTAFTRHPEQLAGMQGLRGVIQGDATNLDAVRNAVRGQDAVIVAVGDSGIARTVVAAMQAEGVRRLVMTSGRGVVMTRPRLLVMLNWLLFHKSQADLARAEGMLEGSGLDWSIVRLGILTNKPFTGQVHTDFEANATGGTMTVARADVAMTLLDVVENPQMIGKALGVGGVKAAKKGTQG